MAKRTKIVAQRDLPKPPTTEEQAADQQDVASGTGGPSSNGTDPMPTSDVTPEGENSASSATTPIPEGDEGEEPTNEAREEAPDAEDVVIDDAPGTPKRKAVKREWFRRRCSRRTPEEG